MNRSVTIRDLTADDHNCDYEVVQLANPTDFTNNTKAAGIVLATMDLLAISLSVLASLTTILIYKSAVDYTPGWSLAREGFIPFLLAQATVILVWCVSFAQGHYNRLIPFWQEVQELVKITASASLIALALMYLSG